MHQKHCPGCFQDKSGLPVCPKCGYDESAPRSALFLPHGMVIGGQYRIGRVLGRPGGFGITYLGWDENLQARVAIKEYLPRELALRTGASPEVQQHSDQDRAAFEFGMEQFLREARIVAQFDHPNIVRVRNFFNANGTAYLVMDYYEGMSLGDYLSHVRATIDADIAVPLVKPILDGLQYVHERGVVHRDLKPHNVYLASIGRAIVLDFGAARQAVSDRTQSVSVVLTEGYAPLEQYQRRVTQGPPTDVYGVAATLYRMVTGQILPIALDRIGRDPMEENGYALLPAALRPVLKRALAVRPDDRYPTARAFREALDECDSAALAAAARGTEPAIAPTEPLERSSSPVRSVSITQTLPPTPPVAAPRPAPVSPTPAAVAPPAAGSRTIPEPISAAISASKPKTVTAAPKPAAPPPLPSTPPAASPPVVPAAAATAPAPLVVSPAAPPPSTAAKSEPASGARAAAAIDMPLQPPPSVWPAAKAKTRPRLQPSPQLTALAIGAFVVAAGVIIWHALAPRSQP